MKDKIEQIRKEALERLENAKSRGELEEMRVKYLGKKGELTALLKQMGKLSAEERPVIGQLANEVRQTLERVVEESGKKLEKAMLEKRLEAEALDVTVPGERHREGKRHPMYTVLDEIEDIFVGMGFEILDGYEIEESEYNFTKLNTSEGHPARDWSTLFI